MDGDVENGRPGRRGRGGGCCCSSDVKLQLEALKYMYSCLIHNNDGQRLKTALLRRRGQCCGDYY